MHSFYKLVLATTTLVGAHSPRRHFRPINTSTDKVYTIQDLYVGDGFFEYVPLA